MPFILFGLFINKIAGKMSSSFAGKSIICKAAIAFAPNEPLRVEEIEVEAPKKGEVRIKVSYCMLDKSCFFIEYKN